MGTRGAIGFHIDGQDKVTYNHYDSYPSVLGYKVMNFIRRNKSDENLKKRVKRLGLIDESKELDEAVKTRLLNQIEPNLGVGGQSTDDPYCLLRGAQGDLSAYLKIGYMIDSSGFLLDSLFCEWAYIVNLDTGKLELYRGFNKKPSDGRYGNILEDKPEWREAEYYGVALIGEIPFEAIRNRTRKQLSELADSIERSACFDQYGEEEPEEYPEGTKTMKELVETLA